MQPQPFGFGLWSSTTQLPSALLHLPPPAHPFCPTLLPHRNVDMSWAHHPAAPCRRKAHRQGVLAPTVPGTPCRTQPGLPQQWPGAMAPSRAAQGSEGRVVEGSTTMPGPGAQPPRAGETRADGTTSCASWLCLLPPQRRAPFTWEEPPGSQQRCCLGGGLRAQRHGAAPRGSARTGGSTVSGSRQHQRCAWKCMFAL